MEAQLDQLVGTWRHSHEEDTATERVYRRGDYEFPPARGRDGFEFRPDHSCAYLGISARDGTAKQACTWQPREGTSGEVVVTFPGGEQRVLQIVSVDRDRLVVKKP